MNKSPKAAFSLLIPAVIFVAAGAAIFAFQNFSNKRVLSGFAGYVYSKPIFGQNRFEGILIGPSSTGWAGRKEVSKVSITPDTTVEEFDARNGGAILGKDKLPISCKASLVYRLDPSRVKEFMEDYGGIAQSSGRNDDEVADEIMLFAYKNFIPHSRAGGIKPVQCPGRLRQPAKNFRQRLHAVKQAAGRHPLYCGFRSRGGNKSPAGHH